MATYTTAQYIEELEKRKKAIDKAKIIAPCALVAHDAQIMRMTEKGVNGLNRKLVPKYSMKPMYINTRTSSPKAISAVGKTGQTKFKSGKAHKTTYFQAGYREFKAKIGRGMFQLFGQMMRDFATSLQRRGDVWVTGMKQSINADKADNLIKKYGIESFRLTKEEKINYSNCINKQLNNILRGA